MKRSLRSDLARLQKMSFRRTERCGSLLKGFHANRARIDAHPQAELLWKMYDWLLVPLSLWPIDFEGLSRHLLDHIETGTKLDAELLLLLRVVHDPPDENTQKIVGEFEPDVEAGRYERLIRRPEKFEELEAALNQDEELATSWREIKKHHDPKKYQNSRGVIRRRL